MSAVVELLQELVRIPSVNPQGDPGTVHTGEGEIAKFVGDFLVRLGMDVELQFAEKDRPNVVGRLRSKNPRRHILLGPHLDTVSVGGMTIEPFSGDLRDGRVWGRGASDTKGPMAAMLIALRELVETKRLPGETDIWFAGLMGEESGNEGVDFLMNSDFFPRQGVKLDFGIAGEPTDLKIVNRHKGALWLRITTHGRSCHGSRPDLGDNAILKARRVLDYLATELPAAYGGQEDPVLGRSTFSLNTIRGGTKVNIVPDLCALEVDHRSLPGVSHDEVVARVRQALPDCDVEVVSNRPGLNTPAENPYIQKLADVLARRVSSPPEAGKRLPRDCGVERRAFLIGAPWFADCSVMAKAGVPAIAFGPGSIQQAHTKDEFIAVADLELGVEVFREFLADLG